MLTAKLFKNTDIKCADNYIMLSPYMCDSEEIIDIIAKYGVAEMILSPAKSMIRITIRKPMEGDVNVITIENPTHTLLKKFWDLDIRELNVAIKTYMMQGEIKANDGIKIWQNGAWREMEVNDEERKWIMASILGESEKN